MSISQIATTVGESVSSKKYLSKNGLVGSGRNLKPTNNSFKVIEVGCGLFATMSLARQDLSFVGVRRICIEPCSGFGGVPTVVEIMG